jgi:hypothetical protein
MIRVEISDGKGGYWRHEMPAVPREGDRLELEVDTRIWAVYLVKEVTWTPTDDDTDANIVVAHITGHRES